MIYYIINDDVKRKRNGVSFALENFGKMLEREGQPVVRLTKTNNPIISARRFLQIKRSTIIMNIPSSYRGVFYAIFCALFVKINKNKLTAQLHRSDYKYAYWPLKLIFWLSDSVVFVAPSQKRQWMSGTYKAKSFVIPPFTDLEMNFVNRRGVPTGYLYENRYVLCICNLTPTKNLLALIEAYEELDKPTLSLLLVGDVLDKEFATRVYDKACRNRNIKILSGASRPKIFELIRSCEFLIQPSLNEAFPTITQEALYFNKMVFVHDTGYSKDYLPSYCIRDMSSISNIKELINSDVPSFIPWNQAAWFQQKLSALRDYIGNE